MAKDVELIAPFRLAYTYKRSTGPVVGRFLTSLREGRIEGIRTVGGEVLVPPRSYDPRTGARTTGTFVPVGPEGTIQTWTWVSEPRPGQPLTEPFAWALIRLDGADSAMLHAVRGEASAISQGTRVRAVWAEERIGSIRDIACFEVIP